MRNIDEENPALGWRAIRLGLDRPGLLRSQVRALLRAASGRSLKLMFPMIAVVEEFDKAKSLVEVELTHLRRHGHELPERVEIGTMVEVPSLLFQLNELLERVDFLSVGSNDLMQFLYAADRGNPRVSERFDPLSAPVLRALKDIADKAKKHGKPVTLCGELASQPIGALALTILGYRTLSLTPSAVGPVKALLLDLDCRKGEETLLPCLEQPVGSVSIRHKLEAFAVAEGLQLCRFCRNRRWTLCWPAMHWWKVSSPADCLRTPTSSCRVNSLNSLRSSKRSRPIAAPTRKSRSFRR